MASHLHKVLFQLLDGLFEHRYLFLFHGLVLGYLLAEAHVFLAVGVGFFGLEGDFFLHGLQGIHQLLDLSLAGELFVVFSSQQFNAFSEVFGQHATIREVVLSGLVDLFGGEGLEVVDAFLYSLYALIHALVRFFLQLFILAL